VKHVTPTPSPNGRAEIPAYLGANRQAAARAARTQTEFLPDPSFRSLRAIYFALDRFQMGGLPLGRIVTLLLLALAAIWATGFLPARWPGTILFVLAAAAHITYAIIQRRRDFVAFEPGDITEVTPASLAPEDKIRVYITGLLSVEGKYRRFTFTPAFYRTFATGEHALLGLVRKRSLWNLAAWPEDEIGMWYAFILPDQIQQIESGEVSFTGEAMPGLALAYSLTLPAKNRFRGEKSVTETLYLAAETRHDADRILADLLCDASAAALSTVPSTASSLAK